MGAALAFQVQSTAVPLPLPCATTAPPEPFTCTSQARAEERRAVKRTGPPTAPSTLGS
jgi:hypothetical protein